MGDDGQDSAQCLICHESVLSSPAAALVCGHVYHAHCISVWLSSSRSECPQCKKVTTPNQLRHLDLEVVEICPGSLQEAHRLMAVTSTERQQLTEDLMHKGSALKAALNETHSRAAEQRAEAESCKRQRREKAQGWSAKEEEHILLTNQAAREQAETAEMQSYLDKELHRQFRKLPIARAQQDDKDVREERRKLRSMNPSERARMIHEACYSAREQDAEARQQALAQKEDADAEEAELRKVKLQISKLRREYSELREAEDAPLSQSQSQTNKGKPNQAVSSPLRRAVATPLSSEADQQVPTRRTRAAEPAPAAPASSTPGDVDDDNDDMLFGGKATSRKVLSGGRSGGLLSRLNKASSSSAAESAASATTGFEDTSKKKGAMRSLFSKQKH
eukprot:TRINITY_DN111128_c0_g1_i1.p1 TRINITY_DN111128_c0_g1~~TRINITY_DN111128_c0_g1_i1.p1  ORF type:complete len:391 (-),score=90.84 TRINITY_DN111128_c0_g1_i1:188-1360(-)